MITESGVLAIGTAVSIATEIIKAVMDQDDPEATKRAGPTVALCVSLLFTIIFVFSQPNPPVRTDMWPLLLSWLTVTATAMGVYKGTKLTVDAAKRVARSVKTPKDGD